MLSSRILLLLSLTPWYLSLMAAQRPRFMVTLGKPSFHVEIGGVPLEPFGAVTDALFVPGGVAVLDLRRAGIHLLTDRGKTLSTFGRMGSGPGEMREAVSMRLIDDKTLMLLDRALQRITFYDLGKDKIAYRKTLTLEESSTEDACFVQGRPIVYGYSAVSNKILHFVDAGGRKTDGWGDTLFAGGPYANSVATSGRILCLQDPQIILVAPYLKGEIRAYSQTGALLWTSVLADYVAVLVKVLPPRGGRSGVLLGKPPGHTKTNKTIGIHRLSRTLLLVQTALTSKEHPGSDFNFEFVESRILRLSDGREIGRTRDLPVILAIEGSRMLVAGGEPDLWVESRSFTVADSSDRPN